MSAKKGGSESITVALREIRRYRQNQPTEHEAQINQLNKDGGRKNGGTQCKSLSRTTSTTILALEKLQRRKNACFNNNGIYYEGQSMTL